MTKRDTTFIITGEKEINKAFDQFAKEMKKALRKDMRKGMKKLQKKVQELTPKDTGDLARSIKVYSGRAGRNGVKVEVRTKSPNFVEKFLEWGTENADGSVRIEAVHQNARAFAEEGPAAERETINLLRDDAARIQKQCKLGDR